MYKENNLGKISYSNKKLGESINLPESTVSKCNRSLVNKNYLMIIKDSQKLDSETRCLTDTKVFKLDKLG